MGRIGNLLLGRKIPKGFFLIIFFFVTHVYGEETIPLLSPELQNLYLLQHSFDIAVPQRTPYDLTVTEQCDLFPLQVSLNGSEYAMVSLLHCPENFLGPVRNQQDFGLCWDFGENASLESLLAIELYQRFPDNLFRHIGQDQSRPITTNLSEASYYTQDYLGGGEMHKSLPERIFPYAFFPGKKKESGFSEISECEDSPTAYLEELRNRLGFAATHYAEKYQSIPECQSLGAFESELYFACTGNLSDCANENCYFNLYYDLASSCMVKTAWEAPYPIVGFYPAYKAEMQISEQYMAHIWPNCVDKNNPRKLCVNNGSCPQGFTCDLDLEHPLCVAACPWGGNPMGDQGEAFGGYHKDANGEWVLDRLQVNWYEVDRKIMTTINRGRVVIIPMPWNEHLRHDNTVPQSIEDLNIHFRLIHAQDKAHYKIVPETGQNIGACLDKPNIDKMEDCSWNLDPEALDFDNQGQPQIYNFGIRGHIVDIVGYLRGGDTNGDGFQDIYYIIRNSHGDRDQGKDTYLLLPSPTLDPTTRYIFSFRPYGNCDKDNPVNGCINAPRGQRLSEYWMMEKVHIGLISSADLATGRLTFDWNTEVAVSIDTDYDGVPDLIDNCPSTYNSTQEDYDLDGAGNVCDLCPHRYDVEENIPYYEYSDLDNDGILDECDPCPMGGSSGDADNDGVPNCVDPCPTLYAISNWIDQFGTPIADSDTDGIADICDNCPQKGNPFVEAEDWNSELIQGECRTGVSYFQNGDLSLPHCTNENEGGARYNKKTFKYGYLKTSPNLFLSFSKWTWQPDHDLDGTGDACDTPKGIGPDNLVGDGWHHTVISSRFVNGSPKNEIVYGGQVQSREINSLVAIDHDSGVISQGAPVYNSIAHPSILRYCWVPQSDYSNRWGTGGYCTTSNESSIHFLFSSDFAYSHGSDPMPLRQGTDPSWQVPTGNNIVSQKGIYEESPDQTHLWDWKPDLEGEYLDLYEEHVANEEPTYNPSLDPFITYAVSGGPQGTVKCTEANDLVDDGEGGKTQNSACFKNDRIFARSTRDSFSGTPLSYAIGMSYAPDQVFIVPPRLPFEITYTMPEATPGYPYADDRFDLWRYNSITQELEKNQRIIPQTNLKFGLQYAGETILFYEHEDERYVELRYQNDARPSDTAYAGSFALPASAHLMSGAILNDRLYVSIGASLYSVQQRDSSALQFTMPTTYTHVLTHVGTLPEVSGAIHLIAAGTKLYTLTHELDGLTLHRFNSATTTFDVIPMVAKPLPRNFVNISTTPDGVIYLLGGFNLYNGIPTPINDVWRYSPSGGLEQLAENLQIDLYKTFTIIDDETIKFITQPQSEETTTSMLTIDRASDVLAERTITIKQKITAPPSYCLNDNDDILEGGTFIGNICTPFTHPWYKQYSIGSTVYSVAGKGDRLYVGTGSAIKVYDISDPNAMVLKSTFTTNKTVYDLEVADGDIMYAATSGGIYKLNTVNPDTLSIIGSFYSTPYNYQYRIQLYNGNLYVGDDNGINIRNPENFARVAYVNIGSTMDFAITNGEIAMYWDDFWSSGIDIRDVDNLATRKAWDYPYCSTGELTTDHGAFYLSCDGYEYRFAGLPNTYIDYTELDGDMREMQENYLYNGWVYIPDGNKVKLSTNNTVPAICGNGIIEPGEFCDGNSEDCAMVDPTQWDSGSAICNSTCTAWDNGDCYDSGC